MVAVFNKQRYGGIHDMSPFFPDQFGIFNLGGDVGIGGGGCFFGATDSLLMIWLC